MNLKLEKQPWGWKTTSKEHSFVKELSMSYYIKSPTKQRDQRIYFSIQN